MNILEGLNDAQKQVVVHDKGPLLVLAGAGAGKTKAITHRIGRLIQTGVLPESILAITFTNKAAKEMRERVRELLKSFPPQSGYPFISTFHSLGVHILRASGGMVRFSILDRDDSISIIKKITKDFGLDPKTVTPRSVLGIISRMKGDNASANELYNYVHPMNPVARHVAEIRRVYDEECRAMNSVDFDDLIAKPVELLQNNKKIRDYYRNIWKHIMIDEYQDTNIGQYEFANLLTGTSGNVCAIGDIDQAIYSWRGADFKNVMRFEDKYPDRKLILLEKNYRSSANILEAAERVIEKNIDRKPKRLLPTRDNGESISLFTAGNDEEEANYVVSSADELIKGGTPPGELAVLYRANFQSRAIEEACLKFGIPYQVLGTKFYERKEVKDILAYLRVAQNPDDNIAIARAVNIPPRGIGRVTLLAFLSKKELRPMQQKKISVFLSVIEKIRNAMVRQTVSHVVRTAFIESGYEEMLRAENSADAEERMGNIAELISIASRYDHLPTDEGVDGLIADATLMSEQDTLIEKKDGIRLMTVHAAKGLEFDTVFIVGLEDGLFPHAGMTSDGNSSTNHDREEEERRLFYVAITRAKRKLYLTLSQSRNRFGKTELTMPSSFLSDIPDNLIELDLSGGKFGEPTTNYIEYD